MISLLTGTIKLKSFKSATIDIHGLGFEVFLPQLILEKIKIGQMATYYTHLQVREDALELYGFETLPEKNFFELLISVSGVGPKSALSVLSIAKLEEIKKAILRDGPTLLRKVSGIGQKTAERIVVELKNKLSDLAVGSERIDLSTADNGAFDALMTLGYSASEVREALRKLPKDINDENEIIKQTLKMLGKK